MVQAWGEKVIYDQNMVFILDFTIFMTCSRPNTTISEDVTADVPNGSALRDLPINYLVDISHRFPRWERLLATQEDNL